MFGIENNSSILFFTYVELIYIIVRMLSHFAKTKYAYTTQQITVLTGKSLVSRV